MSILNMNKYYTNKINNDIVCKKLDITLTNHMENIIISNNGNDQSHIDSKMKEDLSAKPRHLIQVVNRQIGRAHV